MQMSISRLHAVQKCGGGRVHCAAKSLFVTYNTVTRRSQPRLVTPFINAAHSKSRLQNQEGIFTTLVLILPISLVKQVSTKHNALLLDREYKSPNIIMEPCGNINYAQQLCCCLGYKYIKKPYCIQSSVC